MNERRVAVRERYREWETTKRNVKVTVPYDPERTTVAEAQKLNDEARADYQTKFDKAIEADMCKQFGEGWRELAGLPKAPQS